MIYKYQKYRKLAYLFVFALIAGLVMPGISQAAALTSLSDTMSRMGKSELSNHEIKFTATADVAAAETITIDFPDDSISVGSVDYTDIDVDYSADATYGTGLTLGASASGATWGAAFDANEKLTITSGTGTIVAGQNYRVRIGTNASGGDAQITNPGTANTYAVVVGVGNSSDTGKFAIAILDTDLDQFSVTANVDPTLTFSLDNNLTAFGTLSTSSVTQSGTTITATISTNGEGGYTVKINDEGNGTNPGLNNPAAGANGIIGSADNSYTNTADLSAAAGYGIQASSASATVDARYLQTGDTVGGYERSAQDLATYGDVASSHTIAINSFAKAGATTPAGSYTDTVTLTATGNF